MLLFLRLGLTAAVVILLGGLSGFHAQRVADVRRDNAISFYAVSDLTKPRGAQLLLRGARIADPKDWPASFYSVHPGGSCTSTLVGARALLTAAHCVSDGGSVVIALKGKTYDGVCARAPLYSGDSSADWAMCLIADDVPVTPVETVSLDPSRLAIGKQIMLTGFGCTASRGTGGNDGTYRIGEAVIDALPGKTNDIQTKGAVALCFGDSGGPAFVFLDSAKKRRVQVSVNSRVERKLTGELGERSYLSSLSTAPATNFLVEWSTRNNTPVCGVNSTAATCGG